MGFGLDDVVAAETCLSHVDGDAGTLILRGLPLEAAVDLGFERVTAHLWDGLVSGVSAGDVVARLGAARMSVFDRLPRALAAADGADPVTGLRAMLATLPDDVLAADPLVAVAAPAVFLGGLIQVRHGASPKAPDPRAGHAADFLRMAAARAPTDAEAAALDIYLAAIVDHGMNASTFVARVIASTRAGLAASVVGAVGALSGPLHGGAPGPVLDLIDAAAGADDLNGWLEGKLAGGERLMGFGHRVYRVRDPRADVLKAAVHRLGTPRIAFAERVEAAALAALSRHRPNRRLDTNVEFYTALLLEAVGFDRDAFTAVFAVGRVSGWIAHAAEQQRTGRLVRPGSRYVGPAPDMPAAA